MSGERSQGTERSLAGTCRCKLPPIGQGNDMEAKRRLQSWLRVSRFRPTGRQWKPPIPNALSLWPLPLNSPRSDRSLVEGLYQAVRKRPIGPTPIFAPTSAALRGLISLPLLHQCKRRCLASRKWRQSRACKVTAIGRRWSKAHYPGGTRPPQASRDPDFRSFAMSSTARCVVVLGRSGPATDLLIGGPSGSPTSSRDGAAGSNSASCHRNIVQCSNV
jgi:hypothetical protein